MKFRHQIKFGLILILLLVSSCGFAQKQNPNIVLIVADDLGYGDLGTYGATKIATPTIDKLAEEGMKFTNAYVASSLCSPSRYSILTGRYSWRTRLKFGVLEWFAKPLIKEDRTTIGSLLQRNGYYTPAIGKWHLGFNWALNDMAPENPDKNVFGSWDIKTQQYIDFSKPVKNGPTTRGFDYFYGMAGSNNMIPYAFIENDMIVQPPTEGKSVYEFEQPVPKAPNWDPRTLDQHLTGKAVEVIDNYFAERSNQPLFLYYPTSAIHRPCLPTRTKGDSRAGLRGDMVEEFDLIVKQIVEALKRNHAYENTLLIITSDNGPRPGDPILGLNNYKSGELAGNLRDEFYLNYFDEADPKYVDPQGNEVWKAGWLTYGHQASGGLRGFKSDAWEGGLRVPLIIHWPGHVDGGQVSNRMVVSTDFLATFAEIVGDELQQDEGPDSYSFMDYLRDPNAPQVRSSMVISSGGSGAFVVRQGPWKYIQGKQPGWNETNYLDGPKVTDMQLYNLAEDEAEDQNLFGENPPKAKAMQAIVDKVQNHAKSEASDL